MDVALKDCLTGRSKGPSLFGPVDLTIECSRLEGSGLQLEIQKGDPIVCQAKLGTGWEFEDGHFEHKSGFSISFMEPEYSVGNVAQAYRAFLYHSESIVTQPKFGISLEMGSGEVFYGGGENFGSLTFNGRRWTSLNTDALGSGSNLQYQATPLFWSSLGYLLEVVNDEPVTMDFGHVRHEVLSFHCFADSLKLSFQPAMSPEEGVKNWRQSRLKTPLIKPPDWSAGFWLSRCFYKDQDELEKVLSLAGDLTPDVVNLDARTWMNPDTRTDFKWDESRFQPFQEYIPSLLKRGHSVCLWENPYVSCQAELFSEGHEKGYFAKDGAGDTLLFDWVPEGLPGFAKPPQAALVDFTNLEAKKWWQDLHRPYLEAGVGAFKTDFGEEVPFDAVFSNGKDGFAMRNVYADLYSAAVYEVVSEYDGIIWARSGFKDTFKYPVKWGGDSQSHWRGLRASIRAGLSQAVGGTLFWSHDCGGFYGERPTPELFLRWCQTGMWGSHFRLHGTSEREPWEFGAKVELVFSEALALRNHILPWILTQYKQSLDLLRSFIRPMWFLDPSYGAIDDQFVVGDDNIIVAPFLSRSGGRTIVLPEGKWKDLRYFDKYIEGPTKFKTERTDHIPVFYNISKPCEHRDLFVGMDGPWLR